MVGAGALRRMDLTRKAEEEGEDGVHDTAVAIRLALVCGCTAMQTAIGHSPFCSVGWLVTRGCFGLSGRCLLVIVLTRRPDCGPERGREFHESL